MTTRRTDRVILSDSCTKQGSKQLLHLVFGGERASVTGNDFKDQDKLDIVGIYPNDARARQAWTAKAQRTDENAEMLYSLVHLHRPLEPESTTR